MKNIDVLAGVLIGFLILFPVWPHAIGKFTGIAYAKFIAGFKEGYTIEEVKE